MRPPPDPTPPCASPLCARLLAWWRGRKDGTSPPAHGEFDLASELPQILPLSFLIDVQPTGFRIAQVGATLVERSGRDATGRAIDESLYGDYLAEALRPLSMAVRARQAVLVRGRPYSIGSEHISEALYVPLLDATRNRVAQVLGVVDYGPVVGLVEASRSATFGMQMRVLD
ncbi:hypothetical protein [Roseiterribacter gracilis]|uniref:PAS domain-containing protein n=1 Tax=Roseiterribacter gracilis TaxID=2812848 RepID=A0A8S8X6X2_9PROT|nr:hypothetical protein TMPK1_09700 [Rhodospirillales bacterium TMPK1]